MRIKLILCLLAIFCVNRFYGKEPKFKGFDLKPLENSVEQTKENNSPDGPFCQSVVSYFIGTLQNKHSAKSYDVEFQLRLWADETKKKIHVKVDGWNEDYSSSKNFELDFYYDGTRIWCDIDDDECASPLAKRETNFTLDLNTANGNYFHLLNFNFFNNSFALNKAKDKCTRHQLDDLNDEYVPDLDQLHFCVCCDSYEPNKLLGCPNDEWNYKKTTCNSPTSTNQPIVVTTPPQPKNITCKSVVGYYSGIFQNKAYSDVSKNVEFQIRVNADDTDQKIYFYIDKWNGQKSSSSEFKLFGYNGNTTTWCNPLSDSTCSIEYVNRQTDYFEIDLLHYPDSSSSSSDTDYYFLTFPNFYNSLTLTNAIRQCTKNQYQYPNDNVVPHTKYYDYRLCCGDEYNPDSSLGCPKNPWA